MRNIPSNQVAPYMQFPKALFSNPRYAELSNDAKMLYMIYFDRSRLSARNGFCNNNGEVIIYYPNEDIQAQMHCGHDKVTRIARELETAGLITRTRNNKMSPYQIVVHNCESPAVPPPTVDNSVNNVNNPADTVDNLCTSSAENAHSSATNPHPTAEISQSTADFATHQCGKIAASKNPSNNDNNQNMYINNNNNNSSSTATTDIDLMKKQVRHQIEYDLLLDTDDDDRLGDLEYIVEYTARAVINNPTLLNNICFSYAVNALNLLEHNPNYILTNNTTWIQRALSAVSRSHF